MTAWQTAHLMNIHISKGPPITASKLLPGLFDTVKATTFTTRKEWEKNKQEIHKMARFHSRVFRRLKKGEIEGKTADTGLFMMDIKGQSK